MRLGSKRGALEKRRGRIEGQRVIRRHLLRHVVYRDLVRPEGGATISDVELPAVSSVQSTNLYRMASLITDIQFPAWSKYKQKMKWHDHCPTAFNREKKPMVTEVHNKLKIFSSLRSQIIIQVP